MIHLRCYTCHCAYEHRFLRQGSGVWCVPKENGFRLVAAKFFGSVNLCYPLLELVDGWLHFVKEKKPVTSQN